MIYKILFPSLLSASLVASDIGSALTCLKPEGVTVEREDETFSSVQITSCVTNINADGIPTLFIFEDGFTDSNGKDKEFLAYDSQLTLRKTERFKENRIFLKSHGTVEDGTVTSYISNVKAEGGFPYLDVHPDGGRFIQIKKAPTFSFSKSFFDQSQEIDALKTTPSRIPLISGWVKQFPTCLSTLSACHRVDLIDDIPVASSSIPKIMHTILTRVGEPFNPYYFSNNLDLLPKENGWRHVVWVIEPSQCEDVELKAFSDKIEIRSVIDLFQEDRSLEGVVNTLRGVGYFELSCFLRYFILNKFGGWYVSPDVELIQSLDRFTKPRFVGCIDSIFKPCISTSFFGATLGHPILQGCLNFITTSSLKNPQAFGFGKMDAYIRFGLCLFSKSFLEFASPSSDLILGPSSMPTHLASNPIRMVTDITFKTALGTMGVHFTEGGWRR